MSEMITIREHWERPTPEHPNGSHFLRIGERFAEATGRFVELLDPEAQNLAQMGKHAGPLNFWYGKKRSEETRKKISEAHLRFHRDKNAVGKANS